MSNQETRPKPTIVENPKDKTTLIVRSEIPDHEGYIVIPKKLTPRQFNEWWTRLQANDDEKGHPIFQTYAATSFLVKDWHLKGVTEEHLDPSGLDLPDMAIAVFVIRALTPLVQAASDPKLSPAKSTKA